MLNTKTTLIICTCIIIIVGIIIGALVCDDIQNFKAYKEVLHDNNSVITTGVITDIIHIANPVKMDGTGKKSDILMEYEYERNGTPTIGTAIMDPDEHYRVNDPITVYYSEKDDRLSIPEGSLDLIVESANHTTLAIILGLSIIIALIFIGGIITESSPYTISRSFNKKERL